MSPSRRDQTKNGKILVVDDEPAERDGLARLVGQWGYDVETASSGEEALNLIETQHPAVVLTDLVLPEVIRIGYRHGLVESKTLSVDATWSAIKFTHPVAGKVYKNSYGQLPTQ